MIAARATSARTSITKIRPIGSRAAKRSIECDLPPSSPGSRSPTGRAEPAGIATAAARRPRRRGRAGAGAVLRSAKSQSRHAHRWPRGEREPPAAAGELAGDPFVIGVDQADRDAQVRRVGAHLERLAGRGADALRGERDERRSFVGDAHPQVDAVAAGHGDAARGEHVGDQLPAAGVLDSGGGDRGDRRRIVEHLQQHRLQDAAAPARAEQPAVGDRGDDVAGAADGGEAQVGAVALGVAADVHGSFGQRASRR